MTAVPAQPCICSLLSAQSVAVQDNQASREGLKIAAMSFMRLALATAPAAAWQPHLAQLGPLVVAHAGERYYKVGPAVLVTHFEGFRVS